MVLVEDQVSACSTCESIHVSPIHSTKCIGGAAYLGAREGLITQRGIVDGFCYVCVRSWYAKPG